MLSLAASATSSDFRAAFALFLLLNGAPGIAEGPFCVHIVGRIVQKFASLLRIAHLCTIFAASSEEEASGWCRYQAIGRRTWASRCLFRAAAAVLSGDTPPFLFVQNTLNTASIMFTYYYRVWHRVQGGGYDSLLFQGTFHADYVQAAHSRALRLAQSWGAEFGDCSVEYSTAREARSPYVVYFPPF